MKIITSLRACALLGLTLFCAGSLAAQSQFKIGGPAPEFRSGRWLKHGPITKLDPGTIYVLEFWATWCGPCRAAMPHLTELAHKYAGKVVMIGVDILERSSGEAMERKIDKFVADMGAELDYPVCRDTADDFLKKNWFDPTGSAGIPTTIVVDATGKIAWVGHPSLLEPVIEELLAGKFDYAKAADKQAASVAREAERAKALKPVFEAVESKDWPRVVALIDELPQYATMLWLPRFAALLHLDPAEALVQAKECVIKKDPKAGSYLQTIVKTDGLPKEMYQFVADTLVQENQESQFYILADAVYQLGDGAKAAEYLAKFKEYFYRTNKHPSPEAGDMLDAMLKKYQETKK